jgi:hemerythrin-like domain-containing protein
LRALVREFNHIHKAIRGELLKLEDHAGAVDPNDAGSVAGFAQHFGMVDNIQTAHSHEEENGLWPRIEAKHPGLLAAFPMDHEAEREYMAEIKQTLGKLQGGQAKPEEKQALARRLYRYSVALSSHLSHHMNKEETLPYPTFAEGLTEQEEDGMIAAVLNGLPEEMMPMAIPWKTSYLTDEEVVEEFDHYVRILSTQKVKAFFGPIATMPDRWASLTKMRPAMAQYAS